MSTTTAKSWWKSQVNVSMLLHAAIMIGGWLVFFGSQHASIVDQERRIAVLEAAIVPRREQDRIEKLQEEKDRLLEERLTHIERTLDELVFRARVK